MLDFETLLEDLLAEGDELDGLVAELADQDWSKPTPAEGWTIGHQISHLAWTDECSLAAIAGGDAFQAVIEKATKDPAGFVEAGAREQLDDPPGLLARWRRVRRELADELRTVPAGTKLPWFGPPMSAPSMATARLMETWAHGRDVADALGIPPKVTRRLKHIAHLGFRTRGFAYLVNDKQPPTSELRLELSGVDGELWTFGPEDAEQRVTGSALDFVLLGTQRINRANTDLKAVGADADEWLNIVQTFAGPPGKGRAA
ncbi:TIGR03084 family protein [Pseudonocardiaceae bacterium YIM PH 21723]|nr:TIGR03084 family protein [Pseudonocardiaceae bacterium YIM PH 21723]